MTMSLPAIVISRNVLSANRCITTFAIDTTDRRNSISQTIDTFSRRIERMTPYVCKMRSFGEQSADGSGKIGASFIHLFVYWCGIWHVRTMFNWIRRHPLMTLPVVCHPSPTQRQWTAVGTRIFYYFHVPQPKLIVDDHPNLIIKSKNGTVKRRQKVGESIRRLVNIWLARLRFDARN